MCTCNVQYLPPWEKRAIESQKEMLRKEKQLLPQIIINWRRHNTEGLQPTMMMLWAIAGAPLAVYNVVENFNIALQIQPQILTSLSFITWTQCRYYSSVSAVGMGESLPVISNSSKLLVFAHRKDKEGLNFATY